MNKKWFGKISVVLAATLLLSACGSGGQSKKGVASTSSIEKQYPAEINNDGKPVKDATLKVAVISDTGFKGIFNPFLYSDSLDSAFMADTMAGAFPVDSQFKLIADSDETPIKIHIDKNNNTVSYTINPKFKWSNGDPVTTKDIVKTYEIAANQKYIESSQSPRYGADMMNIKGIEDYNKGKSKTISGLKVKDDSHMDIELKKITPSTLWGSSFASEFVNAKSLEGVPMDKIQQSDAIRKNPPSYGPYVIKEIIPGEKVVFEANKYYYKGEPKVKHVEMEVLPSSQTVAAIKSGKYDIVEGTPSDTFPQLQDLKNINIVTRPGLFMSYIGFKQGKWDSKTNQVVTDPNAKMNDVSLKKAMAYAIDSQAIGDKFANGLKFNAESPIAPVFKGIHDPNQKGYKYDEKKAKELLDKAGYKDVNGDGIREDKNGKPLQINFAMMSGGETQEPISQYLLQQWKKIGLNVKLVDGRLIEPNDFYARLTSDDPKIDAWLGAFTLASDPNPTWMYGKNEQFNLQRYTSKKLEDSLEKLNSPEALDAKKRVQYYHDFEKEFFDEAPAIPLHNGLAILPVNKRVKHFDWSFDNTKTDFDWSKIELTAKNPIADQ